MQHYDSMDQQFTGVLCLRSTTIADFHYGILNGHQAVVNMDKSSIINNRGIGIQAVNPRILKVDGCIFQNSSSDAINITLLNTPQYEVNAENIQINPLSCKILIASSRFM